MNKEKRPLTPLAIAALVYCVIVALIAGIIVGIKLARGNSGNSTPGTPIALDTEPSLELAESVCKKYGGEGEPYVLDESSLDSGADNSLIDVITGGYSCTHYDYNNTDAENQFAYTIYFFKDDKMDEVLSVMASYDTYTGPGVKVLEKSEDFLKIQTASLYMYIVKYNNTLIQVNATDSTFAEYLLVELGFPEHNWSTGDDTGDTGDYPSEPTMEVAEALCEKYGGKFLNPDNTRFGGALPVVDGLSTTKICEYLYGADDNSESNYSNESFVFSYQIGILEDSKKDTYWNNLKNKVLDYEGHEDISKYIILEDSDEMFKACNSMAGLVIMCVGVYENAAVGISSGMGASSVDEIFAELGFPNRNTLEEYSQSKGDSD